MRTLLSTLHTILWDGARWTAINVSDLMTEAQIKKQHRKALLVVHPDQSARDTLENRVRAERAFKALDAGMKRYLEEQSRTPAAARY
jgi:cyclin G-associated kinase